MAIKVEKRGKYGGVKIHLDPDDCQKLIQLADHADKPGSLTEFVPVIKVKAIEVPFNLALKMGQKIRELLEEEPDLFEERTPEQVAAILAKETEKAQMQLNAVKSGLKWQKVDPDKLKAALLKHVK